MRLSKREIVLLYVLVMTLIVFLCMTFMVNPAIKALNEANSEVSDFESELKSKKYKYNQDKSLTDRTKEEADLLDQNKKKIKKLVSDIELNIEVRNFFNKNSAVLKNYTSSGETDVEINKQKITEICLVSISVEISKMYLSEADAHRDIKRIISAIKEEFKTVIVNRASYNVSKVSDNFEVNANMNFSIYMSR